MSDDVVTSHLVVLRIFVAVLRDVTVLRPCRLPVRSTPLEGDLDDERGSPSDRARDRHRAAVSLHAVDQPGESGPLGGVSATVAVVANEKTKCRTLGVDVHIDLGCAC